MSTKIKERLKQLAIQMEHEERLILDGLLVEYTNKTCDEAIEMMTDDQVKAICEKIKLERKKRRQRAEQQNMLVNA